MLLRGVASADAVEPGDMALTHTGRFEKVLAVTHSRYKGPSFEVQLNGRYKRRVSLLGDQQMLVRNRSASLEWVGGADLVPGPYGAHGGVNAWHSWACQPRLDGDAEGLAVAGFLPDDFVFDTEGLRRSYESKYRADSRWALGPWLPVGWDLGYLMGIFAAEGSLAVRGGILSGGIGFTLHEDEVEIVDRIRGILSALGARTSVYPAGRGQKCVEVRSALLPLAFILKEECRTGAHHKRVPPSVLTGSAAARSGFLEGVLDGDGRDLSRSSNIQGRRDLKTSSKSLAWGVKSLLADAGHWVGVAEVVAPSPFRPEGGKTTAYSLPFVPGRAWSRTLNDEGLLYRPILNVEESTYEGPAVRVLCDGGSIVTDFVLAAR